jgi:hypothetical protein
MNDPWNRFPRWLSTEPFGESLGYSGEPPISSGGILGNLGQTVQPPWMDSRPAPIASAAPRPPVGQPWDYSSLYRSPLEISDPEAAKFLAAWRRIYLAPSLFGFRPPTNSTQSGASVGMEGQFSLGATSDFTSALDPLGERSVASPGSNGWERFTPMTARDPSAVRSFAPAADFNASDWGATSPASRMSPGPMSDSDQFVSHAPSRLTGDLIRSRTGTRGAGFFSEAPSPLLGDTSVNELNPKRTTDARHSPEILSDVTPDNLWIPGADYAADGHHEFPRANYKGKRAIEEYGEMSPETRKVFDEAKTGRLYVRSINGRRHEYDAFGRIYEAATDELLDRFMKENNIANRRDLSPDHARAVLKAVAESQDPRILSYRNFIRLMQLFPWLRSGARGTE